MTKDDIEFEALLSEMEQLIQGQTMPHVHRESVRTAIASALRAQPSLMTEDRADAVAEFVDEHWRQLDVHAEASDPEDKEDQ
jgi:hypothetical protein